MNAEGLISAQEAKTMFGAGQREKAQTIVANMVAMHSRELAGWQWLQTMLETNPPSEKEEAALWDIVARARLARY